MEYIGLSVSYLGIVSGCPSPQDLSSSKEILHEKSGKVGLCDSARDSGHGNLCASL
jgi:hypothetical protein